MNSLLKQAREDKGLKTREVAQLLKIDQALISKFESGLRKPTKEQIIKLANLLNINLETILTLWLKEKILHEIKNEKYAFEALKLVESELLNTAVFKPKTTENLQKLLDQISLLLGKFQELNTFEIRRITKQLDLLFTYECNQLNGNSMNFEETKLIINEGVSIAERSTKEHYEIINFFEAIQYCKESIQQNNSFSEKELFKIHSILIQGIEKELKPQEPNDAVYAELKTLFKWYEISKENIHPIVLAAEAHIKLMQILPFRNYNNQVAFLVMNWILLQHKFNLTIIQSDSKHKDMYISELEKGLVSDNYLDFYLLMAQSQKDTLEFALSIKN